MLFFSCFLLLIKFKLLSKLHGMSYCLFLQRKKKQYMQQQTCAINLSYTLHKVTVGLSSLELCYFFGLFQDFISVILHLQIYPYVLVNKNGCTFAGYDLPGTCIYIYAETCACIRYQNYGTIRSLSIFHNDLKNSQKCS